MAYADGELPAVDAARVEAAIVPIRPLRGVDGHRALRAQLGTAFSSVLAEPVPARLRAALRVDARDAPSARATAGRSRPRWTRREWLAMAASLPRRHRACAGPAAMGCASARRREPCGVAGRRQLGRARQLARTCAGCAAVRPGKRGCAARAELPCTGRTLLPQFPPAGAASAGRPGLSRWRCVAGVDAGGRRRSRSRTNAPGRQRVAARGAGRHRRAHRWPVTGRHGRTQGARARLALMHRRHWRTA